MKPGKRVDVGGRIVARGKRVAQRAEAALAPDVVRHAERGERARRAHARRQRHAAAGSDGVVVGVEHLECGRLAEEAAERDANGYDASDDFLAPDDDAEAVAPEPADAPEPAAAAGMGAGVGGAQGSRRSKRRRKRRVLADE